MHTLQQLRSGELAGATRLDLSCGLREFPREIFDLADTLEVLNLSGNALSRLPDDLGRLRRLKVLFCSANDFDELPAVVGECPALDMVGFKSNRIERVPAAALPAALRWLILTDNRIAALPEELGQRPLQKLMLAGNRLQALPESMAGCERLELLRIAANRFQRLPAWLAGLPRLAWLAYAGNPLCRLPALADGDIAALDWSQLTPGELIGEGASGAIHRGDWWQADGSRRAVALKLFKGGVTSDGTPASEMAACLAAGRHPQLIEVLGRIAGHPQRREGLVLELLGDGYRNLAGPPSLASCTRDVYPPERRFDLATVLRLAGSIAAVMTHLHGRGIGHGDLYAHNILCRENGACLLGDFGAASFLPREDAAFAGALRRLEVRAFGCLLEELLERCEPAPHATTPGAALLDLQRRCVASRVAERPDFAEIDALFRALARRI
ncbi:MULTISPECIES: leucine-rich repeat-containing protein kinase family protein [Pseudomonas aeruginosa group]|uniref:leucine-rich repeat-containing protein kinase family protein n=1 Tax=Pseudomonas aeruginosa group TaxID=136841 RepID=UPI0006B27D3E|nr:MULTISPECIES: leucine-rich repeat-containing protein kinase family protein [Pseudomonas aeruginosa group]VTS60628.1 E3 ubiquitin-protein ligase slrP [Streptococcus dysgalactiae subsp. equisimilis]KRU94853.1 protein kinase [Pseudomonas aeruginosa]MBG3903671.1 serine/threonine-protein kinase [Pseudomonas aeruginosa]MBG4202489.1 serine/threonine-protein kinase [Pseudomonas aeruginosa]MBG4282523.1 serine/threonine-protein kinase [Pseudomonas aeruginosa]